jgi:hypothetical protein
MPGRIAAIGWEQDRNRKEKSALGNSVWEHVLIDFDVVLPPGQGLVEHIKG